jgi:putative hydrolase of the HAD superfamily
MSPRSSIAGAEARHVTDDGQPTLIIDADDTLWENNIHFEEATERFLDLAETHGGTRERARELLESYERRNIPVHGYGTRGFTRSMMDALEAITGKSTSAADRQRILTLGERVRNMPIQFLPGVKETLPLLRRHNRLILFTKGDHQEQSDKVRRSGATSFFHLVEVTSEKSPADYERLVERHEIELESGWMVGNSPRSDVNPALEVGLGAVYIPHPRTWNLEHEEVQAPAGARLKVLKRFSELLEHFFRRRG